MTLTTNLLRRRPRLRPSIYRNFSSSSDNHSNDAVSSQPNSSFSSYLTDVKASLSKQAPPNTKRPFSPSSNPNPPPKISSSGEIRKNLSEFRRLSAPPPPPTPTPTPTPSNISFQELYKRNVASKSGEGARKVTSFDAIRESLKNLQSKNQDTIGSRQLNGSTSTPFFPSFTGNIDSKTLTGEGGQSLPWHIFGKEVEGKDNEGEGGVDDALKFVRPYNYEDLGNKLMNLRPEKKKDERNWFSLQELSERLQKLRVNDEKEMEAAPKNLFTELRASLAKTVKSDEKRTNVNLQRIDMLNNLGAEQDFMLSPPKEHLVEKYFHPDNMSSAEKLKIELKKVRDEFKMSESDCGSARVQVAQLTTKIKHLSTALHKKDKHSRKGLQAMVQQRKKLLKYLRRTDWDSYCLVLSKLGLRDKADYKN